MQAGGVVAFGVRREAAPVERCLACEADAVGNDRLFRRAGMWCVVEPIPFESLALPKITLDRLAHFPETLKVFSVSTSKEHGGL